MVTSLFYCHRVVMIYFHKGKKGQKRNCSCNIFARSWTRVLFAKLHAGNKNQGFNNICPWISTQSVIKYSKYFDNVSPRQKKHIPILYLLFPTAGPHHTYIGFQEKKMKTNEKNLQEINENNSL